MDNVVDALIAAHRANLDLSFERAAAIDLAGRNVFEAVRMSVTPKIIETPWIAAVAIDGIEVKVIAKVTVRANLARLVGGAGEETIIARVGEGIVTTVGSTSSHKMILESPELISSTVLEKGLDRGTAYYISSLDITCLNRLEQIACGNQKNDITLELTMNNDQKNNWDSLNKWGNENVELYNVGYGYTTGE